MPMRRARIGTAAAAHGHRAFATRSLLAAASVAVLLLIIPEPAHGEFESVIREIFPWYYEDRNASSRPNLVIQAGKSDDTASSGSSGISDEAVIVEPCWKEEGMYETCPDAIASHAVPKGTCDIDNTRWRTRYEINLETVRNAGCKADVIWYGDSIIQYWDSKGRDIWSNYMENDGFHSIPAGLSGDKTGDLLCRIQQGEFSRQVYPKVVIISIGINDVIFATDKDLETDEGVERLANRAATNIRGIIGYMKQLACEVTVVITSLLTTIEEVDVFTWPNRATPAIYAINREYKKIAEQERKVHFVDCHGLFVESKVATGGDSSEGSDSSDSKPHIVQINQELMKDGIHPSRSGYEALAQCVIPDFVKPIAIKNIEFSPPSEYVKYMPSPPPSFPPESLPPPALPSPPLPSPPHQPAQPVPRPAAPMPSKRPIRRRPKNKRRRPKNNPKIPASSPTPRPVPPANPDLTWENFEARTQAIMRTASTDEEASQSPNIVVINHPPLRMSPAVASPNLDTAARVAAQPARARSAPSRSEEPPKDGISGTLMLIAIVGLAILVVLIAVVTAFAVTFKRKHKRGISKRTASLADIRTELGDFHLPDDKEVEYTVAKMGPNKLSHAKHRRCASDGPWNLEKYDGDTAHYSPAVSRRDRGMRHRSFDAADLSYDGGHGNGASVDNSMSGWGGAFPQRQLSSVMSLNGDDNLEGSLGGSNQASQIMAAYNDPRSSISEDGGSLPSNEARLEQDALTDNSAPAAVPACEATKPRPGSGRLQGDYDKAPTLASFQNEDPRPDHHTPNAGDSPADHHSKSPPRGATAVSREQHPPQAAEQLMGQFFKRIYFWGSPSTGVGQRRKRSNPLPVTMHPMDTVTAHLTPAGQPPNATGPSSDTEAVVEITPSALMMEPHHPEEDYWGLGSGSLNHYLMDAEEGGNSREFPIDMSPPSSPAEHSTTELPLGP